MRKLAEVVRVDEVAPIEGADAIEAYRIGGWWVVDRKGAYHPGDLTCYIMVDAWVPNTIAPFLSKGKEPRVYNMVPGEKLRTVRLRGQLSQGLLISGIPDAAGRLMLRNADGMMHSFPEGADAAEWLGIQKWEPPEPASLSGQTKGNFPSEVPKTDQTRIQSLSKPLSIWQNKGLYFVVTEKCEGSSVTFYLSQDGEFHVCSRNLSLKDVEDNTFWKVAKQFDVERKMREMNLFGYAIQGELLGEGVQGNHYAMKGHTVRVFHIFDTKTQTYVNFESRYVLTQQLEMEHVPVIGYVDITKETMESLIDMADGSSRINPSKLREGLVFECTTEPSLSFKSISNRYLLGQK